MSDVTKIGDFVKAGAAAQAAVDKLTGTARVCVDAATVASRIVLTRQLIDDAIATSGQRRYCEVHLRHARAELVQLGVDLAAHFDRLGRDGQR